MRLLLALLFALAAVPSFSQVAVTIDSQPAGARAQFKVTGANCQPGQYLTPFVLAWTPGPACQVEFLLPFVVTEGTRLAFVEWDDHSNTAAIAIPVPATSLTRFIRLAYEYQVKTEAQPAAAASVTTPQVPPVTPPSAAATTATPPSRLSAKPVTASWSPSSSTNSTAWNSTSPPASSGPPPNARAANSATCPSAPPSTPKAASSTGSSARPSSVNSRWNSAPPMARPLLSRSAWEHADQPAYQIRLKEPY